MAAAAETTLHRSRRRRRFWGRDAARAVPYGLILPVVVVIGGDPRLPALLARQALDRALRPVRADPAQGRVDRARTTTARSCTTRSSGTRCCARSSSRSRTSTLTMVLGMLLALLLVRVSTARAHPAQLRARPRLVDAGRRRRPGLLLDDELPERRRQLRPDGAALRRLLPARLVRHDLLAAQPRHGADRLGRGAVRRDHALRRAGAGARATSSRRPRSTARGRGASSSTSRCRSSGRSC